MMRETLMKAKSIVKKEEIIEIDISPPYFHLQVRQKNGEWTDVWYSKTPRGMEYSCNAATKCFKINKSTGKKEEDKYGCVFYKGPRDRPFCSHTKSVEIYLKQRGLI